MAGGGNRARQVKLVKVRDPLRQFGCVRARRRARRCKIVAGAGNLLFVDLGGRFVERSGGLTRGMRV